MTTRDWLMAEALRMIDAWIERQPEHDQRSLRATRHIAIEKLQPDIDRIAALHDAQSRERLQ